MTAKRPYYTDPLAAAWMAKYFGMMFIGYEKEIPKELILQSVEDIYFKLYIHLDSLLILKFRDSDIVSSPTKLGDGSIILATGYYGFSKNDPGLKIIQRNGIPFMWPEFE